MDRQLLVKYIFYFFSYLLVYIPSFPILVVLIMAGASPNEDHHVLEWIIIGFEVFVTIFGSWLLNFIFRKTTDLKCNDRYSLMIFSLHLILIPLTWKLWM